MKGESKLVTVNIFGSDKIFNFFFLRRKTFLCLTKSVENRVLQKMCQTKQYNNIIIILFMSCARLQRSKIIINDIVLQQHRLVNII
jgi:hypothetical protein